MGAEAQVAVIREATKLYEEVIRGTAADLAALAGTREWRGEFVIGVYAGKEAAKQNIEEENCRADDICRKL